MTNSIETIQHLQRTLVDVSVRFGPRLFVAVVILVVGYFVARWAAGVLTGTLARFELEPPVRLLLSRLLRMLILGLFLILALQNLGVELLPLIAGLGVAGAGVALAMQGVLGNVVAGLTIIFTRPFRVGQYVSMVGEEGRVETIDLFTTTLSHPDLSRVVIPNRKIVGEILHNYGSIRQLDLSVNVAYDTDLSRAVTTVHQVLQANPKILQDPKPVIRVVTLSDYSISLGVQPWVKVPDFGSASGEINQAIVEAFRKSDITIPFPQRDIHIVSKAS